MKTNQPIHIDLLEFVKTGRFDFLKLGQTREWVLNNFANPDGFENGANWRNGAWEIFSYGDIELHFNNDKLYQIFADFTDYLDAGTSINLTNKWIFEQKATSISLLPVIAALLKNKIDFSTQQNDALKSITLTTNANVALHFEMETSVTAADYYFSAFWMKNDETTKILYNPR